jgi:trimeric autotransporter adhesin
MKLAPRKTIVAAALAVCGLAGLGSAQAETIFGMTAVSSASTVGGQGLVTFDSATPGSITTIGSFSGIASGHLVRSIDFRPATGELWAISTSSANATLAQLYTVNLSTAALTAVGTGFTLTGNTSTRVEMDFNPTVDRIRIVTGGTTGNNFRANPLTGGLVQADTDMVFAAGDPNAGSPLSIIGAAYTNSFAGATSTTLYAWDYNTDALVTIGGLNSSPSPNGGQVFTVASATTFLTGNAALGMDISAATNTLYVTHDDPATAAFMNFYTRNLTTGAETLVGTYPSGVFVADISVQAVPEPATWMMGAVGMMGLLAWRRRQQR